MTSRAAAENARPTNIFAIAKRRLWLLALCSVLGLVGAYAYASMKTPQYTATASLLFQQNQLSQEIFGFGTTAYVDPTTEDATDLALVQQSGVAIKVARVLHVPGAEVADDTSASDAGGSDVVEVAATAADPAFAARLANTYAAQFVAFNTASQRAQIVTAASQLSTQIAQAQKQAASGSELATLRSRLSEVRVLESLQTGGVQQVGKALSPSSPSSPKKADDALIGLIGGVLVGLLAIALLERLDQGLRDIDEIKEIVGLPILGEVPRDRGFARRGSISLEHGGENEAFRLIRAQLRFFNVDRTIHSVVVTSPMSGDGKSSIAWNLACAAASMGEESSVLFVEADLRAPIVAEAAGILPSPGVADVLTRAFSFDRAVQRVRLKQFGHPVHLDVLPAGVDVPNPAELMHSDALTELLREMRERYELVIIDAAPTLLVSDSIPLARDADGVIIVARLGRSPRNGMRRLMDQLRDLGANTLGLVINDVRQDDSLDRYGKYRYSSAPTESERTASIPLRAVPTSSEVDTSRRLA